MLITVPILLYIIHQKYILPSASITRKKFCATYDNFLRQIVRQTLAICITTFTLLFYVLEISTQIVISSRCCSKLDVYCIVYTLCYAYHIIRRYIQSVQTVLHVDVYYEYRTFLTYNYLCIIFIYS